MEWNLFIDDERDPVNVTWGSVEDQLMYRDGEWVIARNWVEVLELIVSFGFPTKISFDHDLGENEITGYEIAKKMCDMVMDGVQMPENFKFYVHSKNNVGAENIKTYMTNFMNRYVL